jgi:VCBS repeat-containing protein
MTEWVVTSLNDSGAGTLRDALSLAQTGDTIGFATVLDGGTLQLASTLDIAKAVTINGAGADGKPAITISGDVMGNDIKIGSSDITDITATQAAAHLRDNVQIFSASADLALNGLVLTGGANASQGGAVNAAGTLTVTNSIISGNEAVNGGGIYAGLATLTDTTVSDNVVSAKGGGIDGTSVLLTDSTVNGNHAGSTAGGIEASGGLVLTNSTVSGNSAGGNAGGIDASFATLTNSTVSGNRAGGHGGGIDADLLAHLSNSIVLGNSAAGTGADLYGNGTARLSYTGGNIVGAGNVASFYATYGTATHKMAAGDLGTVFAAIDGTTGGGLLADNGGTVETIALAASATNPALDAGDDTLAPSTDGLGNWRIDILNAGNDGSSFSDLGAVELQSIPNRAPSGVDNTIATAEDTPYVFAASDFGFSDLDNNHLNAVEITTAPAAGTLTDNGHAVQDGDFVSAADINAGELVFTPAPNGNGATYADFTFQVQDNGGTGSGGVDIDPTPRTLTVDVNPLNDAPVATVPGGPYHATAKVALDLAGTGLAVSDVDGASAVETVTLAVGEGTLHATAGNSGITMAGDDTATLTLSGTIAELGALLGGASTGTLSYLDPTDTPAAATTLTLTIDDNGATGSGGALSDSQSVTIDIAAAPETAPVAANDEAAVSEFATVAGNVITGGGGADHDADGDSLAVTAVVGAKGGGLIGAALEGAHGTLTLDADGSFTYRADHASPLAVGATETDSFTYIVSDGRGGSDTATLAVTITGVATGDNGAYQLVGGAGHDTLAGNGGDDHISGGAGDDILKGGSGDDILAGGLGADSLFGNAGNDHLSGSAGDDILVGGVGRDVLDGDRGADILTGGAGRDTFLFDTSPVRGNVDTVTDFTPGVDHIVLSRAVFTALGPAHHLAASAFSDDGTAHTRAQHILYDPSTGDLTYDANGSAGGGVHLVATLDPGLHLHLVAADFLVAA